METSFRGCLFLCYPLIHENIPFHGQHHQFRHFVHKNGHFYGRSSHLTLRGNTNAPFSGRCHQFHHPIHENAHFHGQRRQNESSVMILQVFFTEQDHIVDVRMDPDR